MRVDRADDDHGRDAAEARRRVFVHGHGLPRRRLEVNNLLPALSGDRALIVLDDDAYVMVLWWLAAQPWASC